MIVEKGGGAVGAEAETIDRLNRDLAVLGRAMPIDAELRQKFAGDRLRCPGSDRPRRGRLSTYGGRPDGGGSRDRR